MKRIFTVFCLKRKSFFFCYTFGGKFGKKNTLKHKSVYIRSLYYFLKNYCRVCSKLRGGSIKKIVIGNEKQEQDFVKHRIIFH